MLCSPRQGGTSLSASCSAPAPDALARNVTRASMPCSSSPRMGERARRTASSPDGIAATLVLRNSASRRWRVQNGRLSESSLAFTPGGDSSVQRAPRLSSKMASSTRGVADAFMLVAGARVDALRAC